MTVEELIMELQGLDPEAQVAYAYITDGDVQEEFVDHGMELSEDELCVFMENFTGNLNEHLNSELAYLIGEYEQQEAA